MRKKVLKHPQLLELQITDRRWRKIPRLRFHLEQAATVTLASLPESLQRTYSMSVLLGTNAAIKKLNRDFRGMDKATNVLSFPQFPDVKSLKSSPRSQPIYLGDIALAYQYMVSEAKKDHKILKNHITHLMIHGILHLFGYDHINETEANRMERLEKKIMTRLGLSDPYATTDHNHKTHRFNG